MQIKKMLKVKNGFEDMQRELLVKNASQLLSKNKSESKNKVQKTSQPSAKRAPEDSDRDLMR
jgi:hypothetical protein